MQSDDQKKHLTFRKGYSLCENKRSGSGSEHLLLLSSSLACEASGQSHQSTSTWNALREKKWACSQINSRQWRLEMYQHLIFHLSTKVSSPQRWALQREILTQRCQSSSPGKKFLLSLGLSFFDGDMDLLVSHYKGKTQITVLTPIWLHPSLPPSCVSHLRGLLQGLSADVVLEQSI